MNIHFFFFFFSSRRRHTRSLCDWSSDVCSSDLLKRHVEPLCCCSSLDYLGHHAPYVLRLLYSCLPCSIVTVAWRNRTSSRAVWPYRAPGYPVFYPLQSVKAHFILESHLHSSLYNHGSAANSLFCILFEGISKLDSCSLLETALLSIAMSSPLT